MGKALTSALVACLLVIGQSSAPLAPATAITTSFEPTASRKLNYLYDLVPAKKDGSAIANHLRAIAAAASSGKAPKFEVVSSPTVNKTQVKNSVQAYEQAMTIWQPLGLDELDLTWAFMSEKDYDWWLARVKNFEKENPDTKVWNPKTGVIGHCKLSPDVYCGYGSPKPSGKTFQYNVIGSRYTSRPNKNTVNHEAVHFYQDSIDTSLMQKTPCWFVEGQANLLGNVLDDALNLDNNRKFQIQRVTATIPNAKKFKAKKWRAELTALNGPKRDFCIQTELSYSLGMLIFEHLYGNYSFRQIHELVTSVSESGSFSTAVRQTLGTSESALYKEVAKYLSRQF